MNWYAFFGFIGLVLAAFLYAGLVVVFSMWLSEDAWWTPLLTIFLFVVLPCAILVGMNT